MTWNQFTRAWYLIGCHAAVDLNAQRTISCWYCGQIFDSYDGTIQGTDICAWSCKLADGRWVIHCGYGSAVNRLGRELVDVPKLGQVEVSMRRMHQSQMRDGIIIDSGKHCTIDYDGYR